MFRNHKQTPKHHHTRPGPSFPKTRRHTFPLIRLWVINLTPWHKVKGPRPTFSHKQLTINHSCIITSHTRTHTRNRAPHTLFRVHNLPRIKLEPVITIPSSHINPPTNHPTREKHPRSNHLLQHNPSIRIHIKPHPQIKRAIDFGPDTTKHQQRPLTGNRHTPEPVSRHFLIILHARHCRNRMPRVMNKIKNMPLSFSVTLIKTKHKQPRIFKPHFFSFSKEPGFVSKEATPPPANGPAG
ncbi:hypothetical protein HanIR_Chr16g0834491 [Helianthus annuus]|nr:hypothetical protein HanIR_Chr16g0834491 [Helianthus annuus]